jgi:hypothetical protein
MNERTALPDNELDQLILSHTSHLWKKVAFVIAKATQALNPEYEERALQRIVALVEAGRLESVGDLREPRYSEIRLPHQNH